MPYDGLHSLSGNVVERRLSMVRGMHDFASNDYLGLSRSSRVRERLVNELRSDCPLGATGSRLLTGHTDQHEMVEEFLAQTFRAPSALIFSSGYMANLGVTGVFNAESTAFFSDELNHASLIDGMRLTQAKRFIYRHNDIDDLREKLRSSSEQTKVIVTESLFSQDGDFAPIAALLELAQCFGAWIVIDEAHATGVYGPSGLGLTENLHRYERLVTLHACGKALGAQGAFVVCSEVFRHLIINRARSFIFSTALSPLGARHIQFAMEEMFSDSTSRLKLQENLRFFKQAFGCAKSLIVPFILGSNEKVLSAQHVLQGAGYDVRAIRSPTVRAGTERLRVTLKSFHSLPALEDLAKRLNELRDET